MEEPPLFDVGGGQQAACWLAEEGPRDLPIIDAIKVTHPELVHDVADPVGPQATGG